MNSEFITLCHARGFFHQCTDEAALQQLLSDTSSPCVAYIGFDCTAESLHVGSLMQIMLLRWFQRCGHQPIVLLGGGTTKVGDPSGKDQSRQLLDDEAIARNMAGIRRVFERYLTFGDGPTDAVMVNNADWLDELAYIPFLRDIGPHFTINRMMTFDSVKLRLEREQPLTFLEFNYMILQAYDFVELNKRYGCRLQFGGSDQWGNIVNGMELGRRTAGAELFGLTTPLLTTSSGAKMGKTANGAVWLDERFLSPYDFWQYWRNTEDADVGRFLRLFTELPLDEITRLEALGGAEINEAKKILANEVTRMCHGDAAAREAAETARQTFEQGQSAEGLPTVELSSSDLAEEIPLFKLFIMSGLTSSGGEARRLIKQGGARINDTKIDDINAVFDVDLLSAGEPVKLSAGKKKHALIRLS